MKTAVIYFEGKEVCRVEFDGVTNFDGIEFNVKSPEGSVYEFEEIARFPGSYGYVIIKEHKAVAIGKQFENVK